MASKVPGFSNAVGYWGPNAYCRVAQDQTAAKIRALLQDQLFMNGRPVFLWQPVAATTPGVVACTCDKDTSKTADYKCMSCFVPGTLVRTETGYRPIEDIKIGDRVLTNSGTFERVTDIHQRDFAGDLVEVRSAVSPEPLFVTPAHPFLTLGGSHTLAGGCRPSVCDPYIERGDNDGLQYGYDVRHLRSGKWHARASWAGERFALGSYGSENEARNAVDEFRQLHRPVGHQMEWRAAAELTSDSYLTVKTLAETEVVDRLSINVPAQFCRRKGATGTSRLGGTEFVLDADFLWMIGMYIAEGSKSPRTIVFSLHKDERQFQERLVALFRRLGFHPRVQTGTGSNGNGANVYVPSTTLATWFPEWLGKHCDTKRIPEELMRLPIEKLWSVVEGIYDGDGTKSRSTEIEVTQTSKILALQMVEAANRRGLDPISRPVISKILAPSGRPRRTAFAVNWRHENLNKHRKNRWQVKGHDLAKVKVLGHAHYHGPVYNLEVENDPTYVVEGIVVHNCYGMRYVPGYEKFLHETIHFSSAEAGSYTLTTAVLDLSKKPNRVVIAPGATTAIIETTDKPFSNTRGDDWEVELCAYRRTAGDMLPVLEFSVDAGGTWTPVALTASPNYIGFRGALTGATKPVNAGNIRFRITLERASATTPESPSFEVLRVRHLRRADVNPQMFKRPDYTGGEILVLKTWEVEMVARLTVQGRTIEHEGDRSWTAPLDYFDVSITRDTPPAAVDDRNAGPHPFFEYSSGVRLNQRYAMKSVSLDSTIQNILTHQSFTERRAQEEGEVYALVF